jgi:hypothetical protein
MRDVKTSAMGRPDAIIRRLPLCILLLLPCCTVDEERVESAAETGQPESEPAPDPDGVDIDDADAEGSDTSAIDAEGSATPDSGSAGIAVGESCPFPCDGCCADGAVCRALHTAAGCEVTEGVCAVIPEIRLGGSPFWNVCDCTGRRDVNRYYYYGDGLAGPLMVCVSSSYPPCAVADADACGEGSACIADSWDGSAYQGNCLGLAEMCGQSTDPADTAEACDYVSNPDSPTCYESVCAAVQAGYRGPMFKWDGWP